MRIEYRPSNRGNWLSRLQPDTRCLHCSSSLGLFLSLACLFSTRKKSPLSLQILPLSLLSLPLSRPSSLCKCSSLPLALSLSANTYPSLPLSPVIPSSLSSNNLSLYLQILSSPRFHQIISLSLP